MRFNILNTKLQILVNNKKTVLVRKNSPHSCVLVRFQKPKISDLIRLLGVYIKTETKPLCHATENPYHINILSTILKIIFVHLLLIR